ncbi:MAG: GNAT family N-acetyltransferase, partial [Oscillospiraceae bacterium]|nr:GNAT family N-acetyltransferase [Oscillospiraceae bacterium]
DLSSKNYIGFFQDVELVAVMDLVDVYPKQEIAYIGLFMVDMRWQGQNIGSAIIREVENYLKKVGIQSFRLAINKGNPQSTHFWTKNGYIVIREVNKDGKGSLLEAEKVL